MKDLLKDIVKKLTNNLVIQSPSGSGSAPERKSSNPTSVCYWKLRTDSTWGWGDRETNCIAFVLKSVSSYANHDEIMDQYNKLLDVFNADSTKKLNSDDNQNRKSEYTGSNESLHSLVTELNDLDQQRTSTGTDAELRGSANDLVHNDSKSYMICMPFILNLNPFSNIIVLYCRSSLNPTPRLFFQNHKNFQSQIRKIRWVERKNIVFWPIFENI